MGSERLNVLGDVVVFFYILPGSALRAVGPGLGLEGLQQGSALRQLLQSFWVTSLRMELCKTPLQHVLNLRA